MGPRFNTPVLLPNGDLRVDGPYETHGEVIGDVLIRFMISDDTPSPPIPHTTTLTQNQLTASGRNPDVITRGTFSAIIPGSGLTEGAKVRGIGLAVAVKAADSPDPPAFETYTWCVNLKVEAAPVSS